MRADHAGAEPFRILFVCTGNTCRSPLAEAIALRSLADRGWAHVEVRSAGVAALNGAPASEGSERAARRHGLDLSLHRTTVLTPELVEWADLVLTMSPGHLTRVADAGARDKAGLLTAFAAGDDPAGAPPAVPDPFGGSDADYEATFNLLEEMVERALLRLAPILAP